MLKISQFSSLIYDQSISLDTFLLSISLFRVPILSHTCHRHPLSHLPINCQNFCCQTANLQQTLSKLKFCRQPLHKHLSLTLLASWTMNIFGAPPEVKPRTHGTFEPSAELLEKYRSILAPSPPSPTSARRSLPKRDSFFDVRIQSCSHPSKNLT